MAPVAAFKGPAVGLRPAAAPRSIIAKAERSYVMVKPDGVQRGLVGQILTRFEQKGFQIKGLKMFQTPEELAKEHYKDLSEKPFYGKLVDYILSGPVVCIVRSLELTVAGNCFFCAVAFNVREARAYFSATRQLPLHCANENRAANQEPSKEFCCLGCRDVSLWHVLLCAAPWSVRHPSLAVCAGTGG